jgi:hypothetical protein
VGGYNVLSLEEIVTELFRKETETDNAREPQVRRLPLHQMADGFIRTIR